MSSYAAVGRLLIAVLAAVDDPDPAGSSRPRAIYSAAALKAKIVETQATIKSFKVSYRGYGYSPESYPPGTYMHRFIVAKSPCYLYHLSAHGYEGLDWQDDPLQQGALLTSDRFTGSHPLNRTYSTSEVKPKDGLPGSLPGEFLFLATGIWPLDGRQPPRPSGRRYMLREIVGSEEYFLQPFQEQVTGRWCHVLEFPGSDRIWIDASHGFALIARETHSLRTSSLIQRIELSDHREVAAGIWFPTRIRNIQYDYNAPTTDSRAKKLKDTVLQVLEVSVNDVDDSAFEFKRPPGALHLAADGTAIEEHAGGLDHLNHVVGWMRKHSSPARRAFAARAGFVAIPAAMLLICSLEWFRVKVTRRANGDAASSGNPDAKP